LPALPKDKQNVCLRDRALMKKRRIVIGAIGGNRQTDAAKAFGKTVAEAGCILLTGGKLRNSDEVKDAAMIGAVCAESSGTAARLVGILPSKEIEWEETRNKSLFLATGLTHHVRNVINGLTPDVLIVFGGSKGTLAEAAFAVVANRPLFFAGPASDVADRLNKNFDKYFRTNGDVEEYLQKPLNAYLQAWERPPTVEELKSGLDNLLKSARNGTLEPTELVARCKHATAKVDLLGPTGFPGLPNHPNSKSQFEAIIRRISE
jgi:uncharacterized protein (TIGR00725 family)